MAENELLEDIVLKGRLLDAYGALLTDRQQVCMHLYFDMNLSLSEIAEEMQVSRQSVNDMIQRSSAVLEVYEERLGLLRRNERIQQQLQEAIRLIDGGASQAEEAKEILSAVMQEIQM